MMALVLDCSVAMAWVFPYTATDATAWLRDSALLGRVIRRGTRLEDFDWECWRYEGRR